MFYLFRLPEGRPAEGGAPVAAVIPPPGPLEETATDTNGTNNRFSTTAFTIAAGQQYTLTLTNRGTALHNWALKGVTGPGGAPIATRLLMAGQSESIMFTVDMPGQYQFICDVHPVEMVGTLTVQ
jgi:plastocyanin